MDMDIDDHVNARPRAAREHHMERETGSSIQSNIIPHRGCHCQRKEAITRQLETTVSSEGDECSPRQGSHQSSGSGRPTAGAQ
jgi:hypothetical protein